MMVARTVYRLFMKNGYNTPFVVYKRRAVKCLRGCVVEKSAVFSA